MFKVNGRYKFEDKRKPHALFMYQYNITIIHIMSLYKCCATPKAI